MESRLRLQVLGGALRRRAWRRPEERPFSFGALVVRRGSGVDVDVALDLALDGVGLAGAEHGRGARLPGRAARSRGTGLTGSSGFSAEVRGRIIADVSR